MHTQSQPLDELATAYDTVPKTAGIARAVIAATQMTGGDQNQAAVSAVIDGLISNADSWEGVCVGVTPPESTLTALTSTVTGTAPAIPASQLVQMVVGNIITTMQNTGPVAPN